MTRHEHTELVRRIFEDGWNRQEFGFLHGRAAAELPFTYNGRAMTVTAESLPDLVATWRNAFPDLEMRIRHLIADGDLVAASLVLHGTHRGEWSGRAPTGRRVEVEEMMFFRFDDGLLVEMWETFDDRGLLEQIDSGQV